MLKKTDPGKDKIEYIQLKLIKCKAILLETNI